MDLAEIGEKAFGFALIFSLISTIIVIALLSAGLPPDTVNVPLYAPVSLFYRNVQAIVEKIPTNATVTDLVTATAVAFISGFTQFLFTLVFGLLAAVQTIATLIPAEVRFLVFPLYFIGAFLQLSIWYYIVTKVFSILKSWLPGG